nr:hypothetical protein [Tanacetum cinerariifolium]
MHIYWALVFILPSRVLLDIEQIIRGFLLCQGIMRKDLLEWRLPTGKVPPFSVLVVWNSIRSRGTDVVCSITQLRFTRCVIAKLVVAASAYFIWQERNWRLFKNKKRSITCGTFPNPFSFHHDRLFSLFMQH